MLHTSLKANDSYSLRRLPGQSKYDIGQELQARTTSTSTFTLRTVTQGMRMLEKKQSHHWQTRG
jgi:hypothetical protein